MRCLHAAWLASLPEALRNELVAALSPAEARDAALRLAVLGAGEPTPARGGLAGMAAARRPRLWQDPDRRRIHQFAGRRPERAPSRAGRPDRGRRPRRHGLGRKRPDAVAPPWRRPRYEPSKRRLIWPNGAIATLYSADEPERLRGPQHDVAWCDELGSWRYPEAWDMLMFGLRLGDRSARCGDDDAASDQLIRELVADPKVVVTRGTTAENRANLAPDFLAQIVRKYRRHAAGAAGARCRAPRRRAGRLVEPRGDRGGHESETCPNLVASRRRDRPGGDLRRRRRRDRHYRRRQGRLRARLGAGRCVGTLPTGGMGEDRDR